MNSSSDESDYELKKAKKKQMEQMKSIYCSVKGCTSTSKSKKGIIFFSFPRNKINNKLLPHAKLWSFFTRINNFQPTNSQVMCELHFSDKCIINKENSKYKKLLRQKSVPTIYYRENGEKVEVLYDHITMEYYGDEAEKIVQEIQELANQEKQNLLNLKEKQLQKIKKICRFCFINRSDDKILEMSKLESYSIDPIEVMNNINISMKYSEAFNPIICVNCFEKIVDFENYRKRCINAQNELIHEMEELDRRIEAIESTPGYVNVVKINDSQKYIDCDAKINLGNSDNRNDFITHDDEFFDNETNSQNVLSPSPILFIGNKESETDLCKIFIKSEPEFVDEHETSNKCLSSMKTRNEVPVVAKKKIKIVSLEEIKDQKKTIEKVFDSNEIQQKSKHIKRKRIYECFFCRNKFTGLQIYKTHDCTVKRVKCQVENCDSYFKNQGGYNKHLHDRHNLPKVSKRFCPVCFTCYHFNAVQFDEHCKKCIEMNEYREQQIQCVICKKMCDNLKSYTTHIMLHDHKNLKAVNPNETENVIKNGRKKKEQQICDLCGKIFYAAGGLQRHKQNVHFVGFNGEMYYCDLCPIAKPTKNLLYNHIKSTHISQWHTCVTCGKMYRTRELWRKHQLTHGDFKKNNRCDVCPHRPGFVTKAALTKHMRSNHGKEQPVRKFNCDICKASYSRDDLLIRHRMNVHQIYHNNYTKEIISYYKKY